jgi:hypothetical protein
MTGSDVIRPLLLFGAFGLFVWALVALVRQARRGGKSMRAAGAMLMLFGWGNLRDPRNDTVAEAQDGHVRKGNESGAPPADPP